MKKAIKIIILLIILVSAFLVRGYFIKPSRNQTQECKINYQNLISNNLQHVENCYVGCCEKPYLLKKQCEKFCYSLD